jgi:hypothetical protein
MRRILPLLVLLLLSACAAPKFTVDDGRQVDEALLGQIRTYGAGEQALRPAIARSAKLAKVECDKQWELPFSVASSDDWSANDRVAWVRGLGVDERLTVIANAPASPLKPGDKIQQIDGYHDASAERMLLKLAALRDAGQVFSLKLSSGKTLPIKPFQVCRGYARLAPPNSPAAQDYHWLLSVHPLEVPLVNLSDDEALWLVLWTQGLSEEGGARMKTYHYGSKIVSGLYNLFTMASGIKGAAMAADAAIAAAQKTAATVAAEVLKQQLIAQATAAASARMRNEALGAARKLTQQQVAGAMQAAAANRGALSGVAWVASTAFEKADAWAYLRLVQLDADPLAGFALHQKLIERGLTSNAMVFDPERLTALNKLAESQGRGDDVVAILQGIRPEALDFAMAEMPLASAPGAFSYEDAVDQSASDQPFAKGLVDGLLNMPVASARAL